MWQIILFILFCFLFVIQQNYTIKFKLSNFAFFFLSILFICLVIIRPDTLRDYKNYYNFFNFNGDERFEVTAHFFRAISPNFIFFLFLYAIIAITVKFLAIKENSSYHLLSIITYLSTSFVLHDFIQIRVSCAIAFFLFSIKYLNNKNYLKYFFIILIACLFHKSALMFLFFPIINSKKINSLFWLFFLIFSYFLYLINFNIVDFIIRLFPENAYFVATIKNHLKVNANVFNINQLIRIFLFFYFLFNVKRLDKKKYILLKIFALSIISLPFFGSISVLAYRISEMLGTVIILLLPEVISVSKNKKVGYFIFIVSISMLFYLNNIHNNFGF